MPEKADVNAIAQALAAPFDSGEVKFKAQTVSGNRALAVPFVDARVIQDRLDEVLGVMGWQDKYTVLTEGHGVVCRLSIRVGEEWIAKEDVGGESEQPDEGDRRKAAFSDALKRAAVKFGIGRYLYRTKPQWVDYDPQKRQLLKTPTLPTPTPASAAPAPPAKAPAAKPAAAPPADAATGRCIRAVADFAQKMEAAALATVAEVEGAVVANFRQRTDKMALWPDSMFEAVRLFCGAYKADREKKAGRAPAGNGQGGK